VTYLLDGGINNYLLSNGVVINPNPDMIEEFKILTSTYNAEYGRNAGVLSASSRSPGRMHSMVLLMSTCAMTR